jgi:hypothetical protein
MGNCFPHLNKQKTKQKGWYQMKAALITLAIVVAALVIDRKLVQKFV